MSSSRRAFLRFPVVLAFLAVLTLQIAGCGGGGSDSGSHSSQGTITVINSTGLFLPIVRLTAANGTVSVGNVPIGGTAVYSNVDFGSFSVTAFAANGVTQLAGTSGTLNSSTLTVTLF